MPPQDGDGVLLKLQSDHPTARWRHDYDARIAHEVAREVGQELIVAADRAERDS